MKKNKLKTKKSAAKRFKVTGSGKILRRKSFKGHLRTKKSSSKKRAQRKPTVVHKTYAKKIRKTLGLKTPKKALPYKNTK
jgi:large subunit ribosomal protein L35